MPTIHFYFSNREQARAFKGTIRKLARAGCVICEVR